MVKRNSIDINNVLKETNFKNLGEKKIGKVRDIYTQKDRLILVTTDRHSSFDRIIAHIPLKGEVLTKVSNFWFENTKDIILNHIIATPDPRVVVVKRCTVIPIEIVVRGYITGTTNTSLWTHYQSGERDFGHFTLSDGMAKNQKLDKPVLTPTTKSDEHDEAITMSQIVEQGLVEKDLLSEIEQVAFRLFKRGQDIALKKGFILVDTKYEFGLDDHNTLTLIDEIHTPDSSRYWKTDSYQERFDAGLEPENFDKEFLRLWFKEHSDPYNDETLPEAPKEMVEELSKRYIEICEKLTGDTFNMDTSMPIEERIEKNLSTYTL